MWPFGFWGKNLAVSTVEEHPQPVSNWFATGCHWPFWDVHQEMTSVYRLHLTGRLVKTYYKLFPTISFLLAIDGRGKLGHLNGDVSKPGAPQNESHFHQIFVYANKHLNISQRFWILGLRAAHLGDFLLSWRVRACVSVFLLLRPFKCVCIPLFSLVSFISAFRMAPRRESAASRAQGKRPAEPSQPDQSEARQKGELKYFEFEEIFGRMRWLPVVTISEPIFQTLIRTFYSRVTYGVGGPITSTVRGVEITLSPESICRIFDIPSVGLRVYESKVWATVPGFEPREAIQRLCGLADAQGMGKPSAHSLTVISRILHHMVCTILLPRGGHLDEVAYLEAFIVDSILTGRRIHVGYLMMMHMISCCESKTRVLPYGRFLTRVFKDTGVDLSRETDFEAPTTYDTYDEQSLARMKFEKAPDGSWIRRAERPPPQDQGQGQLHPEDEEEAEIGEMEGRLDPQRDFEQSMPECDIPPPEPMISEPTYTAGPSEPSHAEIPFQAPHAPDHAPWMDLSAQISSLGTRMEELAVVNDTRFHSMEDRIDEYQTGFTSQFEHLDQRLGRLEERMDHQHEEMTSQFEHLDQRLGHLEESMDHQHEEMMAYLRSVFPPPPP
ncbi:hypothetical protein CK203_061502 [Vitis vinifera]|uniref:Putative plant transposon protein domain-containing protein n=1 Tax=Vitis vinifera TaxID=29760 RepID=A0A438GFS6_VITVI|nr:hypothetical protein CK203_061502 [Vitis vinifera]